MMTSHKSAEELVIWGAGGHAKVVAEAAELEGRYKLLGFVDDVNPSAIGSSILGYPVLDPAQVHSRPDEIHVIVGIGNCHHRLRVAEELQVSGFRFGTVIHPSAILSRSASISPGTVFLAWAFVDAESRVGSHVIVNVRGSVAHDCRVEDGVHIGGAASIAGCVTMGKGAFLGVNATVSDHITIGDGAVIGIGSVVIRDVPPRTVVVGVPARETRTLRPDEAY